MKRIATAPWKTLPPVRLDLDGLQELVGKLPADSAVNVNDDTHEYDSLDEFIEKSGRESVRHLSLSIRIESQRGSSTTVRFKPDEVVVHGSSEHEAYIALLVEFLRGKIPWYSWRPMSLAWDFFGILLWLILLNFAGNVWWYFGPNSDSARAMGILALLGIFAFKMFGSIPLVGATKITLSRRSQRQNFWQRNKDDLIKMLISNLVIGLISFAAGWFLARH